MKRLTKISDNGTGMIWFKDPDNNLQLEPCEMTTKDIRLVLEKLAYYENLEEQGKSINTISKNIYPSPCNMCNNGWTTVTSTSCTSCHNTCVRYKEYIRNLVDMNPPTTSITEIIKMYLDNGVLPPINIETGK